MSTDKEGEAFSGGFWFGIFVAAFFSSIAWAFGDWVWAESRDKFMVECVKTYTYDSCLASYRQTPQAPTLEIKKKAESAPAALHPKEEQ